MKYTRGQVVLAKFDITFGELGIEGQDIFPDEVIIWRGDVGRVEDLSETRIGVLWRSSKFPYYVDPSWIEPNNPVQEQAVEKPVLMYPSLAWYKTVIQDRTLPLTVRRSVALSLSIYLNEPFETPSFGSKGSSSRATLPEYIQMDDKEAVERYLTLVPEFKEQIQTHIEGKLNPAVRLWLQKHDILDFIADMTFRSKGQPEDGMTYTLLCVIGAQGETQRIFKACVALGWQYRYDMGSWLMRLAKTDDGGEFELMQEFGKRWVDEALKNSEEVRDYVMKKVV